MPRKRRKEISGELKKPARYNDSKPQWMRALAEEAEELAGLVPQERRWQLPKRIYLQFSDKDARKEAQRYAAIQRKRKAQ